MAERKTLEQLRGGLRITPQEPEKQGLTPPKPILEGLGQIVFFCSTQAPVSMRVPNGRAQVLVDIQRIR